VRKRIEVSSEEHQGRVIAQEHKWENPEASLDGYIDLLIKHRIQPCTVVVECKRATGRNWIFLTPEGCRNFSKKVSTFAVFSVRESTNHSGWYKDLVLEADSPESAFCIVQGQDERNTPMLERIADTLLPSTEGVGLEYLSINQSKQIQTYHFIFPMVVTNAALFTCSFDAGAIDTYMWTSFNDSIDKEGTLMMSKRINFSEKRQ
jgi:hypothetical protein